MAMDSTSPPPLPSIKLLGLQPHGHASFPKWPLWGILAAMTTVFFNSFIIENLAFLVIFVCSARIASHCEYVLYNRLKRYRPILKLLGYTVIPCLVLIASLSLLFTLGYFFEQITESAGSLIYNALELLFMILFVGGIWFMSASTGSFSVIAISVLARSFTSSFRIQISFIILLLIMIVTVIAISTSWIVSHFYEAGDITEFLMLGVSSFSQDYGTALPSENVTMLIIIISYLLMLVCFILPSVSSVSNKIADTVMERITPLSLAMNAVTQGDRLVRVEEAGSADFRMINRQFNQMVESIELGERMERAFSSYVTPQVLRQIRQQHGNTLLPPETRDATVLFSDIHGFTSISEGLAPELVVSVLNRYFAKVVEIVQAHGGYLDKFVGDAFVAVWNVPMDQADHPRRAVQCAVDLATQLQEMNASGTFKEVGGLHASIGIASGLMLAGNLGGEGKTEYTVIGDTVNTASRIQELASQYDASILITEETQKRLPDDQFSLKLLESVTLKGKQNSVTLWEVLDDSSSDANAPL